MELQHRFKVKTLSTGQIVQGLMQNHDAQDIESRNLAVIAIEELESRGYESVELNRLKEWFKQ
jgi:hypothetical protein